MQIANSTKFVQHLGGVTIEPNRTAQVDDEWAKHPVVEKLAKRGDLMISREEGLTPPKAPAEPGVVDFGVNVEAQPEDITPTVEKKKPGHDPTPLEALGKQAPDEWADMNTNSAKAWIRRCDDKAILLELLETEERAKVAAALRARIDTLEARP